MVTKPGCAKKPFNAVPESQITVGELIARLRPKFEDAHRRGWASWKGGNGRPLNYDAGLSDSALLRTLNGFRYVLTSFRPPESGKRRQSPPSGTIQIASDWLVPLREVAEISAQLEPLFEYNGQHDAAAQWRYCNRRLTFEEVLQRMRRTGRDDSVFLAKLVEAAREGHLPTYAPGNDFRTDHGLQDEIYASDLDAWLQENEPHIELRFSTTPEQQHTIGPVSRKDANRARLLASIKTCGGDPNNLPDGKGGLPGLKAKVRKQVGNKLTEANFDSAWKQIRRDAREATAANNNKAPSRTV